MPAFSSGPFILDWGPGGIIVEEVKKLGGIGKAGASPRQEFIEQRSDRLPRLSYNWIFEVDYRRSSKAIDTKDELNVFVLRILVYNPISKRRPSSAEIP